MDVFELNIDGLVGPTHHYAGLSQGNLASTANALTPASPRSAALQGIAKMRFLYESGIPQAVLPPHQRPNLSLLSQLGFSGSVSKQLSQAKKQAPELLSAVYSASSMWAANAATVTASIDTADHQVHFTAANLNFNLHRHQEAPFTQKLLKTIFHNSHFFKHHDMLPSSSDTGDEGAANHNKLCESHSSPAIYLYVYGKQALSKKTNKPQPKKYPARQTLEACNILARSHLLNEQQTIFACQNPEVIDKGVFHNDVISVANESLFLLHEFAFYKQNVVINELKDKARFPLKIIEIANKDMSVEDAVKSYFFNSQLISIPDTKEMLLISPRECEQQENIKTIIDQLIEDNTNPICKVKYLDLKQSMRNGGGPACLRLRVPLNQNELKAMHSGVLINESLLTALEQWVNRHYRDELVADDLDDPKFIDEIYCALDELTAILKLGSIYPFQL